MAPWLRLRLELALDVAGDQLDGEQVADVADLGVLLEAAEVGEGHACAQLLDSLVGHAAVLDELRVALEDRLREQLAARDLDTKLPLQAKDDVEEVDGLRAEVALQGGGRLDVLLIDVERLDQGRGDLFEDFFLRLHDCGTPELEKTGPHGPTTLPCHPRAHAGALYSVRLAGWRASWPG